MATQTAPKQNASKAWGAAIAVLLTTVAARLTGMVETPPISAIEDALMVVIETAAPAAVAAAGAWLAPRNRDKEVRP